MIIQFIITIFLCVVASYYDIKKGIIPDKISIFLISFGIVSNMILSLLSGNLKHILASILSLSLTYLVCYLLWRLKVWGGGDVKLLTGIAAIIPFASIPFLNVFPELSIYPFSFSVILNAILISFPFLFMMIFYLNMKNMIFNRNTELLFNLINYKNFLFFIKSNFNRFIPVKDLEEGMIVNEYYFNDKQIIDLINDSKGNLKVYRLNDDSNYSYYFKSISAGGLTEKDMFLLKIMNSQNIISDYISIKLGFPFAPFITIGLLTAIFLGDIIMVISKNMVLVV
ncbi:MAG: A24 family peptidase [Methanobrevibacter sp.]|uniref:A24 family peptidase n=1 Tax=Methanobrevibacter sp. TaxID=66852 RepID=UPI0026E005E4|nr:A24 family peptidase [Methanobrevibacter sp.]MDO5849192.1 A24 family peptidase [Methanobrevibacter sp.]